MKFQKMFEPINIGQICIKNRIAMAPMNNINQFDPLRGTITQRCVEYYVERARGGVGLIISGVFKVENKIEPYKRSNIVMWPLLTASSLTEYAELADYVHCYGAKIFFQLSAGPGRVAKGDAIDAGFQPVSASANKAFWKPNVTCRALTTGEVESLVEAFANATKLLVIAGIDGVEVHGHEGYLIDQFTTSLWNRRNDKYGGDLTARLRFPVEILEAIRSVSRKDFSVTYRYGIKHFIKGPWQTSLHSHGYVELGRDVSEAIKMAEILEQAGYNALHVDTGCYESSYWAHPPIYQPHGCTLDLASKIKKVVRIPVITANRLGVPELAEKALVEGKVDIIALGRPLLADPYWPMKVHQGKAEDIRPCIGCHEACLNRSTGRSRPLSCSVNPLCGREQIASFRYTKAKRKILVAGGGVAGMEVARVAAIRGQDVVLCEKTSNLGGHLIEASVPDFKRDIRSLLDWYKNQIQKLEIETRLETMVDLELVRKENADVVVIASGSFPIIPSIDGISNPMVTTCCDLLLGKKKVGSNVVVVGGGPDGCETALWLAYRGKIVTVVEELPEVAGGIHKANRDMLLDLLMESKVNLIPNTTIKKIENGYVITRNRATKEDRIECDTVGFAVGLQSEQELHRSLSLMEEPLELHVIGDARKPRKIHDAIWEGYVVGSKL